ncbi:hypothetical protein AM571_CH02982 [Rhizobium etli 8C-3]|uniref:Uncharacterized protein n=2 Tax=Rhizobium TaxID=379 RepID=A0A1L5P6M3_RHIET|nr:hypothetical protein IE4872_CH03086 [Rhizobium gallicum]APO75784.1 hypothetical protein AM571_CH02982 [Rhizobium etli 8C-3]
MSFPLDASQHDCISFWSVVPFYRNLICGIHTVFRENVKTKRLYWVRFLAKRT